MTMIVRHFTVFKIAMKTNKYCLRDRATVSNRLKVRDKFKSS